MKTVLFAASVLFFGACVAYELSDAAKELVCTLNGVYTSQGQGQNGVTYQARVIFKPTAAPGLSELPVIYMQESINDVVVRDEIVILKQVNDDTFSGEPFNVTGNTGLKPGARDEEYMKSLTPDKIQGQEGCTATFRGIKPGTVLVTWPDCKLASAQGIREGYSGVFECNSIEMVFPADAEEKKDQLRDKIFRQGDRFNVKNLLSNYICSCDGKN